MAHAEKKLFLGGRLKRLRRELGLTQTRMAEDLGLSPSYLNHLERNQRAVSAQVLLRLAEVYDLDLRSFSGEVDAAAEADLSEAFLDPLFRDLAVPRHEVSGLVENTPALAEAFVRLYRAYADRGRRVGIEQAEGDAAAAAAAAAAASAPMSWVRDLIQSNRNHFAELERLGEAVAAELAAGPQTFEARATARLLDRHAQEVRTLPAEVMVDYQRRYDPHRRRLLLNETLSPTSRAFALAFQLASAEGGEAIETLAEAAAPPDLATRRLLRVSLTNYLAGAILMPYGAVLETAERLGYDIARLQARFGASFEQVCHRLTTLSRPGAKGVPFFMLRVDRAGNVSKRFAGSAFPFARAGGTCPRWSLHAAFQTPGRLLLQHIEARDGGRWVTLSRTVRRPQAPVGGDEEADLAIGLGCEAKYAPRLAWAQGELGPPTEVGPTCRLCERPACRERAAPPAARTLTVDEWSKGASAFPFSSHG